MSFWDRAVSLFQKIWSAIKALGRFFLNILVGFFSKIVSFFKQPSRLKKLQEDHNVIAVSIRDKLDNGDYNVVTCLFDKQTDDVVDYNTDAVGYGQSTLDNEAMRRFGDKDMLILK